MYIRKHSVQLTAKELDGSQTAILGGAAFLFSDFQKDCLKGD